MNLIVHIRLLCLAFLLCAMTSLEVRSQADFVHFEMDGKFVYLELKTGISIDVRDSVLIGCGFDSLALNQLMVGMKSKQEWIVSELAFGSVTLARNIKTLTEMNMGIGHIQMLDSETKWEPGSLSLEQFGYNEKPISSVVFEKEDDVRFRLNGMEEAEEVLLSGSFNGWSTLSHPMKKSNNAWETTLKLEPGVYDYKFVVDGKWVLDPENPNKRDDGFGNVNSRLVNPNHTFKLSGYKDARKVLLAGSFNDWDDNSIRMNSTDRGWEMPVFLKEGTYTYKFIINGKDWIFDPENRLKRNDGNGDFNSVLELGDPHIFKLKGFKNAEKVVLSGSFNNWNEDELAMKRTSDGWELAYVLASGNYEYKFIVDGKWTLDPANAKTVGSGDYENSVLVIDPNYVFSLKGYADAKNVTLSGNFNLWAEPGYRMTFEEGVWKFPMHLWPAKYAYKFQVDGKWMTDPANVQRENNGYDSYNSVIWIRH